MVPAAQCPAANVRAIAPPVKTGGTACRQEPENIRMNNALPGFIDSLPERQEFKDRIPMERYGSVDEISATTSFLPSEGSGYITGQNIRIDGGSTRPV